MQSGYIYILINPALHRDLLKIGKTTKNPEDRAKEISSTGVPAEYRVAFDIESSDCDFAETIVHNRLSEYRYTKNREFFKIPLKTAISEITLIVNEIENTPLNDREKFTKTHKTSSDKTQSQHVSEADTPVELDSKFIKKVTNSLFRQNQMDINGSEVFYYIQNSWDTETGTRNAIVYYSQLTQNLLVIPQHIINEHLFTPLFEKLSQGYTFRKQYRNLEYKPGCINLKFKIENNYLSVLIKPLKKHGIPPIEIFKIPVKYWPKINTQHNDLAGEIIKEIHRLCQETDQNDDIILCHNLRS